MDFLGLFDPSTDSGTNRRSKDAVTSSCVPGTASCVPGPASYALGPASYALGPSSCGLDPTSCALDPAFNSPSPASPCTDSSPIGQWLPVPDEADGGSLSRSPSLLLAADSGGCGGVMGGQLPPEPQLGNVEYKLKLLSPSKQRFEHLVTQMKWRLREGQGEAIYELGVEDSGVMTGLSQHDMQLSLATLQRMAAALGASLTLLRQRRVPHALPDPPPSSSSRCCSASSSSSPDTTHCTASTRQLSPTAELPPSLCHSEECRVVSEVLVRKIPADCHSIDLRVAVLGGAEAGKSTLLGVLTHNQLDNGRGGARLNILRHLHEIRSGRTSSISHEILGFDAEGNTVDYSTCATAETICERSSKLLTFIDLAGHRKYLKTTMHGLTGYSPHYAMLVVTANGGVVDTTRQHLSLALALQVPLFVIVTKIDLASRLRLRHTLTALESLLKSGGGGGGGACVPLRMRSVDDVLAVAGRERLVAPLFCVNCVTGAGLRLLKQYLYLLSPQLNAVERDRLEQELCEFQIDETFRISDSVVVAGGLLTRGVITENMSLSLGPMDDGRFVCVRVSSIQRCRRPCRVVRAGQAAALALQPPLAPLRSGMVLLAPAAPSHCCWRFQATVSALFRAKKILSRCPATVHLGSVRQTALIESVVTSPECSRSPSASCSSSTSSTSSSSSQTMADDSSSGQLREMASVVAGDETISSAVSANNGANDSADFTNDDGDGDDGGATATATGQCAVAQGRRQAVTVVFCFVRQPEYVCVGQRLLFRQGGGANSGHGLGTVTHVFHHRPASPPPRAVTAEE